MGRAREVAVNRLRPYLPAMVLEKHIIQDRHSFLWVALQKSCDIILSYCETAAHETVRFEENQIDLCKILS